jgi:epoxyqueuosine reductase
MTSSSPRRHAEDATSIPAPCWSVTFASEAGLGWGGKSTMQIHRHLGTWFFLADILTTLELPADTPAKDMCGKCTRCIDACPTQAITAPRRMDARRCISYLTIESKGSIPLEFRRAIGDRIYGCDACLDACPWNRHAQESREAAFQARETVFSKSLRDFLSLTDDDFRALFAKSPIKRIKRPAFLRNVCVALGNTGTPDDLPALETAAVDPHPLVAEHAPGLFRRFANGTPREAAQRRHRTVDPLTVDIPGISPYSPPAFEHGEVAKW